MVRDPLRARHAAAGQPAACVQDDEGGGEEHGHAGSHGHIYLCLSVVFFNDTATTEIYTLSLHDALPISSGRRARRTWVETDMKTPRGGHRSEEHTAELQSRVDISYAVFCLKKNFDPGKDAGKRPARLPASRSRLSAAR